MKRLWARIGMSVDVTDDEYDEIKNLMEDGFEYEAKEMVSELFRIRGYCNGDSYMPGNYCDAAQDNPNENEFDLIGG